MAVKGRRVRRERWVYTKRDVVAVPVEAVVPEDGPSEPCFEPETVELLREVGERANRGDVEWLKRHGRIYQAMDGT